MMLYLKAKSFNYKPIIMKGGDYEKVIFLFDRCGNKTVYNIKIKRI